MSEERDFDEIMRDKLSAPEAFPFSEDKWARMEELIIAADTKKKRRRFFFIFLSGFVTATLILGLFFFLFKQNNNQVSDHSGKQNSNQTASTSHSGTDDPTTTKHVQKKLGSTRKDSLNPTLSDQKNTQAKTETTNNKEQLATLSSSQAKTTEKSKIKKRRSKNILKNGFDLGTINSNNTNNQFSKTDDRSKQNGSQNNATNTNGNSTGSQTNNANTNGNSNQQDTQNNTNVRENNALKEDSIQEENSITNVLTEEKDSTANAALNALASNGIDTTGLKPMPLEEIKAFGIAIFAGMNYNLGLNGSDGKSFSPIAGISLMYRLPSSWIISTGMYYTSVSKLTFQKEITQRTYDFGYRDTSFVLYQQNMQYVSIPLEITKKVRNSSFTLGLQTAYLFQTESKYNPITRSSLNPNAQTVGAQSMTSGNFFEGFKRIDFQPSFAYEQQLYKNFSAQVQFVYGLNDVRDNNWTNNAFFERNKAIRVVLKYKLR